MSEHVSVAPLAARQLRSLAFSGDYVQRVKTIYQAEKCGVSIADLAEILDLKEAGIRGLLTMAARLQREYGQNWDEEDEEGAALCAALCKPQSEKTPDQDNGASDDRANQGTPAPHARTRQTKPAAPIGSRAISKPKPASNFPATIATPPAVEQEIRSVSPTAPSLLELGADGLVLEAIATAQTRRQSAEKPKLAWSGGSNARSSARSESDSLGRAPGPANNSDGTKSTIGMDPHSFRQVLTIVKK